MDVKEAVKTAKAHAAEVFEGEKIRIEEVWFEDKDDEWCVTVGLSRVEENILRAYPTRTHYKTIRLNDNTGTIKSVRNHDKMPVSPP